MKRLIVAAILLTPIGGSAGSLAASTHHPAQDESANSAWLSGLADQELVAVDGSKLTLSQMEGRLELAIVSPAGSEQKSVFTFINARLGTVSDDTDNGEVGAFFRQTDVGLEIQYGDGRTASLVANTADGLTLTRRIPTGESACMSWFPAGHVFSADERRAAVAAYAERLGVPEDRAHKGVHPAPAPCAPAMHAPRVPVEVRSSAIHPVDSDAAPPPPAATAQASVAPAGRPPAAPAPDMAAPPYRSIKLPFTTADAGLAPPDAARLSIFIADFLTSATSAISVIPPSGANSDAATGYFRERLVSLGVPRDRIFLGTRAIGDNDARVELGYLGSPPGGVGASSCLGVETQSGTIGFRNRCAYGIQFAYCLQKGIDPAIACEAGAKQGAVPANGFASLITATDLQSTQVERDFRWIACKGEPGTITARLEHADPPTGRCEKAN